jgi:hypothetical protein
MKMLNALTSIASDFRKTMRVYARKMLFYTYQHILRVKHIGRKLASKGIA